MELLALYLWLKLDALHGAMIGGALLCALALFCAVAWWMITIPGEGHEPGDKDWKPVTAYARPWLAWLALGLLGLNVALPSTKDAAILAGAYFALEAVHSPEGQKVTSLLRAKVNAYLDEQLTAAQKGAK